MMLKLCHNGHKVKRNSDKYKRITNYPYYCPTCDEDMYTFEIIEIGYKRHKKRSVAQ